ncbi:thioesterase [Gloeopeniophorella convolvens]|nr:thioesterase [Gloeopeniophorella convolvens]
MSSKTTNEDSASRLRVRKRSDYRYFLSYRTRWSDNDQYSHVNNAVYYHLFDSVINAYLIAQCNLSPQTSKTIGLVVSSQCSFFSPLSFPQALDLGLRVNHVGKSSVTYEVGIFPEGSDEVAAVGGYTHVFVDAVTRKSSQTEEHIKGGLQRLLVVDPTSSKL